MGRIFYELSSFRFILRYFFLLFKAVRRPSLSCLFFPCTLILLSSSRAFLFSPIFSTLFFTLFLFPNFAISTREATVEQFDFNICSLFPCLFFFLPNSFLLQPSSQNSASGHATLSVPASPILVSISLNYVPYFRPPIGTGC